MLSGTMGGDFPNAWTRILSASVHIIGSCILSFCLARRTAFENLDTSRGWKELNVAKLSILLAFVDSLLFLVLTGILTHGAGLALSNASCRTAFFSCVLLYASSKLFIYNFLAERVWIVWSSMSSTTPRSRWRSPVYILCMISEMLYTAVAVVAICEGITDLGASGTCSIGLKTASSVFLLSYDAYMNVLLTSLFVYPLWKDRVISARLRKMAGRTLIASIVALTTSTVNIAVLTSFHGKERGWLCLLSCGTDVTINAFVIYSVTRSRRVRRWRHAAHRSTGPLSSASLHEGTETSRTTSYGTSEESSSKKTTSVEVSQLPSIRLTFHTMSNDELKEPQRPQTPTVTPHPNPEISPKSLVFAPRPSTDSSEYSIVSAVSFATPKSRRSVSTSPSSPNFDKMSHELPEKTATLSESDHDIANSLASTSQSARARKHPLSPKPDNLLSFKEALKELSKPNSLPVPSTSRRGSASSKKRTKSDEAPRISHSHETKARGTLTSTSDIVNRKTRVHPHVELDTPLPSVIVGRWSAPIPDVDMSGKGSTRSVNVDVDEPDEDAHDSGAALEKPPPAIIKYSKARIADAQDTALQDRVANIRLGKNGTSLAFSTAKDVEMGQITLEAESRLESEEDEEFYEIESADEEDEVEHRDLHRTQTLRTSSSTDQTKSGTVTLKTFDPS